MKPRLQIKQILNEPNNIQHCIIYVNVYLKIIIQLFHMQTLQNYYYVINVHAFVYMVITDNIYEYT